MCFELEVMTRLDFSGSGNAGEFTGAGVGTICQRVNSCGSGM